MPTKQIMKDKSVYKQRGELADAHCHLDIFQDVEDIRAAVSGGVLTIIGDGVDTKSNMKTLEISDNRNIFAALGIDPEHAMPMDEEEIGFNIGLIRSNARKIVAIGEIGLDYKLAITEEQKEKQRRVFERLLDLAKELGLPVSLHTRKAFDEVFEKVVKSGIKKAHFHFFDGNWEQAKRIAQHGFFVSIPPLKSSKRQKTLMQLPMQCIMAETDSPIVGKTPRDVELSVRMIAEVKGIDYEKACEAIAHNTKAFFNIQNKMDIGKAGFMRH